MAKVLVTEGYLTDIADAIRSKNGAATTYRPGDMAAAIQAIPTGGITPTGTKQITQNGTHDVTQYASANVNVQPNLQSKTITQNGTVTPDQGYDGLSEVVVNVSGGGGDNYFKRLTPIHTDLIGGFVSYGSWNTGDTTARSDVYAVENGKRYLIMLGATVGNRFRVALFNEDPGAVQYNLNGLSVGNIDDSNTPYRIISDSNLSQLILINNPTHLFLTIGKTNQGVNGIETYVFEGLF